MTRRPRGSPGHRPPRRPRRRGGRRVCAGEAAGGGGVLRGGAGGKCGDCDGVVRWRRWCRIAAWGLGFGLGWADCSAGLSPQRTNRPRKAGKCRAASLVCMPHSCSAPGSQGHAARGPWRPAAALPAPAQATAPGPHPLPGVAPLTPVAAESPHVYIDAPMVLVPCGGNVGFPNDMEGCLGNRPPAGPWGSWF